MNFQTFRENYLAAAARIFNYDRDTLVRKVKQFKPQTNTNVSNRELRQLLVSVIDRARTEYFKRQENRVVNTLAKVMPAMAVEPEIEITEVLLKFDNNSKLTNAMVERIINHFQGQDLVVSGWGEQARKWTFNSIGRTSADELKDKIEDIYGRLAHNYEMDLNQTIRIAAAPVRGGRIQRLGKLKFENCLVDVTQRVSKKKNVKDLIYNKMPELKPDIATEHIYVDEAQIEKMAKAADVRFDLYTELGANHTRVPWKSFGYKKREAIPVKVNGDHATIMVDKIKIRKIIYEDILVLPDETNVIASEWEPVPGQNPYDAVDPATLLWYVTLDEGVATVHKKYRPSSFTGNAADDEDLEFARSTCDRQVFYKEFVRRYEIGPTPSAYLGAIKKSELFITKGVLEQYAGPVTECDHIKSYVSWKKCDQYIGFPTGAMLGMAGEPRTDGSLLPAFVVIGRIRMPVELENAFSILVGKTVEVITYPLYNYLVSMGANIEIAETIYAEFQDIDLVEFANRWKDHPNIKQIRNAAVGNTIAGGLKESVSKTWYGATAEEMTQIEFECAREGLEWTRAQTCITVRLPTKSNKASFHFHSYAISYSIIQMINKFIELRKNHTIVAFNVDSITVKKMQIKPADDGFIGGFTYTDMNKLKTHYNMKGVVNAKEVTAGEFRMGAPDHNLPPHKRMLIIGPGGIGKTYPHLMKPFPGQVVTVPSLVLKESHKKKFANTTTNQKYHGLSLKKEARKIHVQVAPVVISDKFTLLTAESWEKVINVTEEDKSILWVLGDPEQINNEVNGTAAGIDFFKENGFHIVEISRKPEINGRHAFDYGCFLDEFRGMSNKDQKLKAVNSGKFDIIKDIENIFSVDTFVITGTHKQAHELNNRARELLDVMPFKIVNKCKEKGKIVVLPVGTENVWWGRVDYSGEAPAKTKYEPAFALTIDYMQGQTLEHETVIVDMEYLNRHGSFYTTITRGRVSEQNVLLIAEKVKEEPIPVPPPMPKK